MQIRNQMSSIVDLDPAHLLSGQAESQAESREERSWANDPDAGGDGHEEMGIVYPGDEMDGQV